MAQLYSDEFKIFLLLLLSVLEQDMDIDTSLGIMQNSCSNVLYLSY